MRNETRAAAVRLPLGVPRLAKTLMVKALASTFSGDFGRIQSPPT